MYKSYNTLHARKIISHLIKALKFTTKQIFIGLENMKICFKLFLKNIAFHEYLEITQSVQRF